MTITVTITKDDGTHESITSPLNPGHLPSPDVINALLTSLNFAIGGGATVETISDAMTPAAIDGSSLPAAVTDAFLSADQTAIQAAADAGTN